MSDKSPLAGAASVPDLDILGDNVTIHEGGYVAPSGSASSDRAIMEQLRFRDSPLEYLREVSAHVSGTGWRAYDNVIGQPVYYKGFTENMRNEVLHTPMLQNRIQTLASKRTEEEEKEGLFGQGPDKTVKMENRRKMVVQELNEVAEKMVDNMICKMENKYFIRTAYYLVTNLLTRAYHQGVHVSSQEVLRLRQVADQAAKEKKSIVFLPCHRSHIDYVSLQIVCYRLGIALPTVVAGDNLGFFGLKQFLQRAGAMWIRRSFAGDVLYGTVVQTYIETLMRLGYHIEAFVEGGRSRTGKLLPPKYGILSYVLDAVLSGRVKDAIICPVSTQYDKVIETGSYISELLGKPKVKENMMDFLSATSVLSLQLGRVDVRFHEPWSLRGFIEEQRTRALTLMPNINLKSPETRIRLLRTLGYRVLSDINEVSVIMPTALVGTVLLTLRGRGVGKSELCRRVDWVCKRVLAKGGRVAHFGGAPTQVVVDRALEVLGPQLVGKTEALAEDTYFAADRFQLSFYRNMTIHLFISEALVCVSMYMQVKQGGANANQVISYDALYKQVYFLSQLFQSEFIYPTDGLPANLEKTLENLEAERTVSIIRDPSGKIESVELSDEEREHGRENFDFYAFLIWPFVEGSWLAAMSLMALTPQFGDKADTWIELKKAQDMAQLFGKTLYHQGELSYYESVNKETLSNTFKRFEDEQIILVAKSRDRSIPATCKLNPEWTPERHPDGRLKQEGRLWEFIDTIGRSRQEGKNRRDSIFVSERILALADAMGRELYLKATTDMGAEAEILNAKPGKKGKAKHIDGKASASSAAKL